MDVSRGQYYAWLKQQLTEREVENERLMEEIKALFEGSRGTYGIRRLKNRPAEKGLRVSRRRIGRLLKRQGLSCKTKRKFKVTTDTKHNLSVAPNVLAR
ncbi:IS3 family transposase [Agarilytica rhodophyticola]|uniref:IS3 family transposase n=1 Tax=Agarilytica rhodophyticola TaxID=1737490 RepID=UPI001315A48C|nr:IS3 family transposase [Agarilytica rhodophyticola]